jgi:hypothetical protein
MSLNQDVSMLTRVHAQVTMLLEEMERLGSRQNTFHALNILE